MKGLNRQQPWWWNGEVMSHSESTAAAMAYLISTGSSLGIQRTTHRGSGSERKNPTCVVVQVAREMPTCCDFRWHGGQRG